MKLNPIALAAAEAAMMSSATPTADAVRAYLEATAPKKPARVSPAENPNKVQYVEMLPLRSVYGVTYVAQMLSHTGLVQDDTAAAQRAVTIGVHYLCALTHAASWNAGWYKDPKTGEPIERNVGEVIALMHSELSEALEGYRKGLMDDHLPDRLQIEVEFADTVIRIADTCGHLGLDLAGAILAKMAYNATREDHKLEVRAAGGKAF